MPPVWRPASVVRLPAFLPLSTGFFGHALIHSKTLGMCRHRNKLIAISRTALWLLASLNGIRMVILFWNDSVSFVFFHDYLCSYRT